MLQALNAVIDVAQGMISFSFLDGPVSMQEGGGGHHLLDILDGVPGDVDLDLPKIIETDEVVVYARRDTSPPESLTVEDISPEDQARGRAVARQLQAADSERKREAQEGDATDRVLADRTKELQAALYGSSR